MYTIEAEMTDTFGGQANYCWVERRTLEIMPWMTDRQIHRAVKRELGITGVRSRLAWDCGDEKRYDIVGACVCYFITEVY